MQTSRDFEQLREVLHAFFEDRVEEITPLGNGHIHETYLVRVADGAGSRLVLQRLNAQVFPDLDAVMENVLRVTAHARARLAGDGASDLNRRVLTLHSTRSGKTHHSDGQLGTFRVFTYVSNSLTLERPDSAADVREAGRACGEFARLMDDMPPSLLHTTLPGFHATDRRFDALVAALKSDPVARAREVEREWRLIEPLEHLARESASWAADPQLRVRVTHNDTKLNNILFDAATRRALCLVDLDTVMPGYLAYDFGDLARSALCTTEEDAQDSALVALRDDWIEPLVQGYLSELPADLTPRERLSLARGPLWVVLELALRFLTDYVLGDRYFKVAHPEHNLQRARVQLALLERFQGLEDELRRAIVEG